MLLGLDIGYSQVKVAYGDSFKTRTEERLPAGVAAIEDCPRTVEGRVSPNIVQVAVDGVDLGALIEAHLLQGTTRVLHEDYPSTREYKALFLATLKRLGVRHVEQLVTGLPVNQSLDPAMRRALEDRLRGRHDLGGGQFCDVDHVMVLPQPIGAWLAVNQDSNDRPTGRVLVFDGGHFSVDWVTLEDGQLLHKSCATVHQAGSAALELAAASILEQTGQKVAVARIESAIRTGKSELSLGRITVDVATHLSAGAAKIAPNVVARVRETLRKDADSIYHVVLSGGSTPVYASELQKAFPNAVIHRPADAVLANARGFWYSAFHERARRERSNRGVAA